MSIYYTSSPDVNVGFTSRSTTDNWVSKQTIDAGTLFQSSFGSRYWTFKNSDRPAGTFTGGSGSNWNDAGNWDGGVPTSSTNIILPSGISLTFPSGAECQSVTIQNGATLIGGTNGTLTINTTAGGIAWQNNGTFTPGTSSKVIFNTSSAIAEAVPALIEGETQFYDIEVSAGKSVGMGLGAILKISGVLTLGSGAVFDADTYANTVEYNGAAQTVLNTGGYHDLVLSGSDTKTMPGTAMTIDGYFKLSGTASATAGNNLTITDSIIVETGSTFAASSFSHYLKGNFIIRGGTFNAGTSTFTFNNGGTKQQNIGGAVTGTTVFTFYNVNIDNQGDNLGAVLFYDGTTNPVCSTEVVVNNTFTLTNSNMYVNGQKITLKGATIKQTEAVGEIICSPGGRVHYEQETDGQAILSGSYCNLIFNNQAKDLTNKTINIGTSYTPGTATHEYTGSTFRFRGVSDMTIPAQNYYNLELTETATADKKYTFATDANIKIAGNFSSFYNDSTRAVVTGSTIEFNGTSQQTINNSFRFHNLKINTSTNGGVVLNAACVVNNDLALTQGKISLEEHTLSAQSVSGSSSTSYIVTNGVGSFTLKNFKTTERTIPVGNSSYNPVSIKNSGAQRDFAVRVADTYSPSPSYQNTYVPRYWVIIPSATGNNYNAKVQINASDYTGSSFNPSNAVFAGNYFGGVWNPLPALLSGSGPYTVTVNNVSNNSVLSIGNSNAFAIYSQNFDGTWVNKGGTNDFPDANWTNTPTTGNNSWRKQTDGSGANWTAPLAGIVNPWGNTGGSANFHSYGTTNGVFGTLDLALDLSSVGSKLLVFDYTNASGTDQLEVLLSTDAGSNFSSKGTFTTGPWQTKTVTLGSDNSVTSVIRFKATSDYGHSDIGIDNVRIFSGSVYTKDVGTISVDVNSQVSGTITPKATVKNFGTETQSFSVTLSINGSAHGSSASVTNLAPGAEQQVSFSTWSAGSGSYYFDVCTGLSGDENSDNNCLSKYVDVVTSGYWSTSTDTTTQLLGSGSTWSDGTDKYFIGTGGWPYGKSCYKINISTGVLTRLPDLPEAKYSLATAVVGDSLYAIGGIVSGSTYSKKVYRYILKSKNGGNNWVEVASLSKAIGWGKAVAYGNYIYLAGGYDGDAKTTVSDVYIYNTTDNTWAPATSLPAPRFGGAFSISGSKLVYIAGASDESTLTNTVYVGTIGGTPSTITWSLSSSPFPGNGKPVVRPSNDNLLDIDFKNIGKRNPKIKDGPESSFPAGSLYGLDAAPWGTSHIAVTGGTAVSSFIPENPTKFLLFNPTDGKWIEKPDLLVPEAGSSIGSANLGSDTWKFVSAYGFGLNGTYSNTYQVWTDLLSGGVAQQANIISLPEGSPTIGFNKDGKITKEGGITFEAVLELRESTAPFDVIVSKTVIQNSSGLGTTEFTGLDMSKPYYVVIRYLNGIETWSAQPQYFVNGALNYDFTTSQTQAYGSNLVKVGEKWCIIMGDINQDGKINAMDRGICWNYRGTNDEFSDVNFDGVVNELDRAILAKNKNTAVKCPEGAVMTRKVRTNLLQKSEKSERTVTKKNVKSGNND